MSTNLLSELPAPPTHRTGWPWTEASAPIPASMPAGAPWPTISIITPSYNQGAYLEKTIRSVLLQGYPNLEYIVMDGDSTDKSVAVLKKYDPWITYWESTPDRGQAHAINKGFERASGHIYAWLNSDDYYMPNALRRVAEAFQSWTPDVGAIVGTGHKVDADDRIVYTPTQTPLTHDTFLRWIGHGNFMQPSCFFRSTAWNAAGPLREDLRYCFDVDLWLNMSKLYTFKRLQMTLSHALAHESAKTTAEVEYVKVETCIMLTDHGARDVAHEYLRKMADDLITANAKLQAVRSLPLYGAVHPVFRWIKELAR